MKPVIPDYDWSIFGVRVNSRLFLIMTGAYSGSGSKVTMENLTTVLAQAAKKRPIAWVKFGWV
ncbi:hypothetical protein, partial [Providencia rustigianii]|uniref:hypothetical protein n=1 Tax=Providencia rustigianii TaxID=158850 RepID=UPI00224319FE